MNKKHLTGTTSHHSSLQLKPLVIAVSTALGMATLLTGCWGGGNGGGSAATSMMLAGGSSGSATGFGGSGGGLTVWLYNAGAIGAINAFTSASNAPDPATVFSDVVEDYGTTKATISSSITLARAATEPATAGPYQHLDGCTVYIADGVEGGTEAVATGMEVMEGVTLTLQSQASYGGQANLCLDNDLVNEGAITTAGGYVPLYSSSSQRTDLDVNVDNYFGDTGSTVSLAGDSAYGDGGNLVIQASSGIYNGSDMDTGGFTNASGNGGEGGDLWLYAYDGPMGNLGDLTSNGGASTSNGYGGDGGEVYLYSTESMLLKGNLESRGGDGAYGGGDGYGVSLYIDDQTADAAPAKMEIAAKFDVRGGSSTGAGGNGGSGGAIVAGGYNGAGEASEINFYGMTSLDARGGDGAEGGGSGGSAEFYFYDSNGIGLNQAPMDVSGGNATVGGSGGDGGYVAFYVNNDGDTWTNSGKLTANGGAGKGTGSGGSGGSIQMYADVYDASFTNSGVWSANGGNAESGTAGGGGNLYMSNYGGTGDIVNTGAMTANGGNSTVSGNGGDGGDIWLYTGYGDVDGINGVSNTAALSANGGTAADGYGGSGGYVGLYAYYGGDTTNSGALSVKGANGSLGGGNGGYIYLYAYDVLTNSGSMTANGGNATASGYGGDGGYVDLDGDTGSTNTATANINGGTGPAGDGADGTFNDLP